MHTKYSPSGSHRWLNCNRSLMQDGAEDRGSSFYAEQGTAAHSLLDHCLDLGLDPQHFIGSKRMHKEHPVDDNMASAVAHAVDWLRSYMARNKRAQYFVEYQVKLTGLLRVKQHEQGTADIIIDNEAQSELVGVDYKHGYTEVEVENNSQLMLYLAGYVFNVKRIYKTYRFVIVQPRARHRDGPVREWTCTHAQLMKFVKHVLARVRDIEKFPGNAEAGEWCKWCPHESNCKANTERILKQAKMEFDTIDDGNIQEPVDPNSLTVKQKAAILRHAPGIESLLSAIRGDLLSVALKGQKVPWFKLVRGNSTRSIEEKNQPRVKKYLIADGFRPDQYAPRKMIGVPGIEKLYKQRKRGTKLPEKIAKLITRSEPGVHLALATDRREEWKRGQEFDVIEDNSDGNKKQRKTR